MAAETVTHQALNGINVTQLLDTINAIQINPDLAKFTFRASTRWVNGGYSRTTIQNFYGAGQEDTSRTVPFHLDGDEPPVLLGENRGPNAVETVLAALASCLAVGLAYNAAARGIKIEDLQFELEGGIDLRGFLGLSEKVRPGYRSIQLNCRIKSEAPREKLGELFEYVKKTSPMLDIICNPVPVTVELEN